MKYLISTVLLIAISFISILITMSLINKGAKLKDNFKATSLFMMLTLPIISLLGGVLFLLFKLIAIVVKLQASTFEVFIISMVGAISIFICDFITKKIMIGISTKYFSSKYKNKTLTESEMMTILENRQKTFDIYSLIIMFFINIAIYFILMNVISIEFTNVFLIAISIINLISYIILFKGKSNKNNIATGN
ncbi:hypothetical protein [Clostridium sp.]|uniref:hypothetical protein n=1 Tax=Clostridium sp. TaxID=1506 RepID=UPI002FCA2079